MNRTHLQTGMLLLCLSACWLPGQAQESLSASDVMRAVDDRYDGDTALASYSLILVDRQQRQRVRELRMYRKDFGEDSKSLAVFDSPADIRGTGYLNHDWSDFSVDDDSWLYLPSLQRVKRIASSDTSDSFLGSDFTYADINGTEYEWYDYHFASETEIVDGHECWVIEAVPKAEFRDRAEQATGYSRSISWIRKDNFVPIRSQVWVIRGNRVKYFSADEISRIDDIWTVGKLQVITTRNERQEHASILQVNSIEYNTDLDDSLFTTEYLQRGSVD